MHPDFFLLGGGGEGGCRAKKRGVQSFPGRRERPFERLGDEKRKRVAPFISP